MQQSELRERVRKKGQLDGRFKKVQNRFLRIDGQLEYVKYHLILNFHSILVTSKFFILVYEL